MRSYFAKQSNKIHQGGWLTVLDWAKRRIKDEPTPVKLFKARGGEKYARIIAEVTCDGVKIIRSGRALLLKELLHGKE